MLENIILDKNSPVETLAFMGGKASNLYLMNTQGFSVPAWCCISSEYFSEKFSAIEEDVTHLLDLVDLNNIAEIKKISLQIEKLFLQLEIPDEIIENISLSFKQVEHFAVRSSAVGEDGNANSFAGQLSTYLYVPKEYLAHKIKCCWASVFSERMIQYNRINFENLKALGVAVIIQEMVDSEKSGVLFTVNPLMTEEFYNQAVITAGYGLGEGVVTDRVETDFYVYDRLIKDVVKSEYAEKKIKLVMAENGGLKEAPIEESKRKSSVLDHRNITELVSTATSLFKFYEHEIDLEWAYDKSGKLFITQARPITTLDKEFKKRIYLLDNSNIVESFPGINTPWTLSIIRDVYKTVFTNAVLRLGISRKKISQKQYIFDSLIATHKGRVFYNLTHWYEMMRMIPYTESYIEVWEEMLGVDQNEHSRKPKSLMESLFFNPLRLIFICQHILWIFIRLDALLRKLDKKLLKDFDQVWKKERKGIYLGYSPSDLMLEMENFKKRIFKDWDITLINDIYAFVCTAIVKKLLAKLDVDDVNTFFNDLLFGISGMESVAPVKSIVNMAILIKTDADLKETLQGLYHSGMAQVNILTKTENELKFRKMFQLHLSEFGDRGVEELKLETLTFRENPISLLRMVLEYSEANIEGLQVGESSQKRLLANKELNKKLRRHPLLKFILPFFLKMAIRSINYRENFRLHRSRGYGIVRRLTNHLGKKLTSLNMISEQRDIYFLDYQEISRLCLSLEFNDNLKTIIVGRKQLLEQFQKENVASRYHFNGQDYMPYQEANTINTDVEISGQACSSGVIEGEVLVVKNLEEINRDANMGKDKILVAKMTDPGWVFLMTVSKGLIVEKGSILSHTAIIGRELGIPTIVGVKNASDILKTGDKVRMDGHTGKIEIIKLA